MNIEKLQCRIQHVLPQHLLSRLVAFLANCKIRPIKNFLIKLFIQYYKIDLNIAISSDVNDYPSFNHFFTRALKPGARPIVNGTDNVASPADGSISQNGKITENKLFQAKGADYSLAKLLGDEGNTHYFEQGHFLTIYLAPKDYHRVHMPVTGKLVKTIYIPGKLFSVNDVSVRHVPELFCRNERLICFFETSAGTMAMILVGALLVAGIETVWSGVVTPNLSCQKIIESYEDKNIVLQKGQEMGRFQFGSTVILLWGSNSIKTLACQERQDIRMGELIATTNVTVQNLELA